MSGERYGDKQRVVKAILRESLTRSISFDEASRGARHPIRGSLDAKALPPGFFHEDKERNIFPLKRSSTAAHFFRRMQVGSAKRQRQREVYRSVFNEEDPFMLCLAEVLDNTV